MKTPETIVAAALKYDNRKDAAPKVVAKGKGAIAEKIIELAGKTASRSRSDPALVQILSKLDIDEQIPVELLTRRSPKFLPSSIRPTTGIGMRPLRK